MRSNRLSWLCVGVLCLSGCEEAGEPDTEPEPSADTEASGSTGGEEETTGGQAPIEVTYFGDIKPVVDAKCASCHTGGGIAPFPLQTYADLVEYMPLAETAIHERTMPPWQPDDGCTDYVGDISLTDDEIALIDEWLGEEMPEGDPASEGPPLTLDMPTLTRVDLELDMPTEYVPRQTPDDYRCFLIEWPEEYADTTYVTGFRAVPGNDAIVHHVIAFLATEDQKETYYALDDAEEGPGYTCFGGTNGPATTWLGGWAPGSQGSDLPDGLGLPVPPGSLVILQVHYNALDTNVDPDMTGVELKVDAEVDKEAMILPWTNPYWVTGGQMQIPAGEPDVEHVFAFDPASPMAFGRPITVYSAALHMHLLGKSGRLSVERSNGDSECLLEISNYDFNWQDSYGFTNPVRVESGDQLRLECHHDNSPENQPFVDGEKADPVDVAWGEGTRDEMCLGAFLVSPD